jgi:hypothetical protein
VDILAEIFVAGESAFLLDFVKNGCVNMVFL